ncbi:hypothetical protein [Streptomyces arboris]|uniref:Uncharacterized protein n=1 Tax=Streptomyces arboris TaxID=2600619 RepID=A0A5N5EN74_9ACTN|nr:hypothetical protein [Streptomyces arboris]KAB2587534.1 hypothetical protein F5983_37495 [Streptomyces arboris]
MIRQSTRILALVCVILTALILAGVSGWLSWLSKSSVPEALMYAGGTFVAWTILCATVISTFGLLEP